MAKVIMSGIRKEFGSTVALSDFTLEIESGELVCLLGPSGCGKTTALRILAGFEKADAGTVTVGGEDITYVPTPKRNFGMVFQEYSLFPNMTGRENVAFALKLRKAGKVERNETVDRLLEVTGLTQHADKYPIRCRVASASAWLSREPWHLSLACCSSTSRCRPWTPRSATRCARRSGACNARSASPRSSSRTISTRHWLSRIAWVS